MNDKDWDELQKLYASDFARMRQELQHFHQTGVPRCQKCHVDFVNAVDGITGKVSKYLWKPNCSCYGKNHILAVGGD
jgi:hypothetical protein